MDFRVWRCVSEDKEIFVFGSFIDETDSFWAVVFVSNSKFPNYLGGPITVVKGKQYPMYYVSHALQGAKTRYLNLEKFTYALIITSRKLRYYFQGRVVIIYTNQPLKRVLYKLDASRRLVAWAVELSQFALEYHSRTAIKGQALADFMIECSFTEPDPLVRSEEEVCQVTEVLITQSS